MIFFKNQLACILYMIWFAWLTTFAFEDSLITKIEHIVNTASGKIGVGILGVEHNDTLTINGSGKFPMQSVFKFPLALAILNQVDKGIFSLEQKIHMKKEDLRTDTWSPLREKYPDGEVDITLDELITSTVSQSDNNGCDKLFELIGGTEKVIQFIHELGITDIDIVSTEAGMHKDWQIQYRNWSSPTAMAQLLYKFFNGKILSEKSREYLYQIMVKTKNSPDRLKGLLPEGTIVAHKTGSSGENENGLAAATNDVGIVTLPNGKHFIIVVFVSNSMADEKTRNNISAEISKAVWDTYTENSYEAAVVDAMVAEESEICSTLVAIKPDNNYLNWSNGYVLVVTWAKNCTSYPVGDTISISWGETWVTAVPELKDWYKKNPVSLDKITLRTEQLLGMPLNCGDSCFVEIWVKPDDLFRPAYNNETDTKVSGINFPVNVSPEYVTWFNNNIISSYYPPNGSDRYPWTRLGYTYDWGNPSSKVGLSEFVIKKNSKVVIKSKRSTEDYIH